MNKFKKYLFAIVLLMLGFFMGFYIGRNDIPFIRMQDQWSISIYEGTSPLQLKPQKQVKNPVLTANDIQDVESIFVADPFMIKDRDKWYMFFEVMNKKGNGDIGLAISRDGYKWTYKKIVLDESFHLSYPFIVKYQDEYYMIPESCRETNAIKLYKAKNFPYEWAFVNNIIEGIIYYADPSLFFYNNRWWMFVNTENFSLSLFYCDNLNGSWIEHPESPVVKCNKKISRPAGKIVIFNDTVIRFAQDGIPNYGSKIRVIEILELTIDHYQEQELENSPILKASGEGWNAKGMHHIDPHKLSENRWLACVDGHKEKLMFEIPKRKAK